MCNIQRFFFCVTWLAMVAMVSGCSNTPSDLPDLGQVSGTVTLDGQPLANAFVTFQPTTDDGNASTGYTDADGHYELTYSASNKGALIGKHQVTIVVGEGEAPELPDDIDTDSMTEAEEAKLEAKYASKALLPARYNDETELTADVVAGSNTKDFPLTSE